MRCRLKATAEVRPQAQANGEKFSSGEGSSPGPTGPTGEPLLCVVVPVTSCQAGLLQSAEAVRHEQWRPEQWRLNSNDGAVTHRNFTIIAKRISMMESP